MPDMRRGVVANFRCLLRMRTRRRTRHFLGRTVFQTSQVHLPISIRPLLAVRTTGPHKFGKICWLQMFSPGGSIRRMQKRLLCDNSLEGQLRQKCSFRGRKSYHNLYYHTQPVPAGCSIFCPPARVSL